MVYVGMIGCGGVSLRCTLLFGGTFFCGHTMGLTGISALISAREEGYGTTQDFCGEEEERVSQKCNHDC